MNINPDRYENEKTIRLSNRQFAALRIFADIGKRDGLSARKALNVDERSLRSMVLRGYVSFDARYGFRVTDRGLERLHAWDDTNVYLEREKNHYGKFLQGLDDALSGSFKVREKPKAKTIVLSNTRRRRHAA